MGHIGSGPGSRGVPTFALLDQIVTILGNTKLAFYPFLTGSGETIYPYGSGNDVGALTAATELSAAGAGGHDPYKHPGSVFSYQVDGSAAADIFSAADDTDSSFGTGAADEAFSIGAWVLAQEALGTARSVVAKYRTDAVSQREYDFGFSATGFPYLQLYDQSESADWTSACTVNVLTPFIWQFVIATYTGTEGASAIVHYLNGTAETPTAVETNAYVAMENGTALLTVGSRNSPTPAQVFQGRIALPFVTGKTLTAANVGTIYNIGRRLLGLMN